MATGRIVGVQVSDGKKDMTETATDYTLLPDTDFKALSLIPGKKGIPFLGMTPWLFRDFYGTIQHHYERYGLVSKIGLGFQAGILALGPDNAKTILLDKEKNFSSNMGYKEITGPWFGDAIIARVSKAPADSPNTVTLSGLPPKRAMLSCTQCRP